MTNEIIRLPRLLETVGMKRTWVYDEIKRGKFPAPVKLGARAVGWRRSEVHAWLESREAMGGKSAETLRAEAEAMLAHADALESEGAN
jgi:prophage regulatory protein